MAQLTIDDVLGYLVEGQRLEPGMVIRRLDIIDGNWYEGNVGKVVSTHPETHEQRTSFALIVPGYAPSPLRPGDDIEIVSWTSGTASPMKIERSRGYHCTRESKS